MKAAAPITGGISCPPVEPTDSIAAARVGVKPDRDISGMVTMPTAMTFLTAAPEIILNEAGGRISDVWGAPLRYDVPDMWHRRGLLASNGVLHEAVRARLAPLFPEPAAIE